MSENIRTGAMNAGGAVVTRRPQVGGSVAMETQEAGGDIEHSGGGAPSVSARWGQITGDITNQTDLVDALAAKLTTPAGSEGQFLVYHDGAWTGTTMETWQGGDF